MLKVYRHPLAQVTNKGIKMSPMRLRRPYMSIGVHAKRDCWPYLPDQKNIGKDEFNAVFE